MATSSTTSPSKFSSCSAADMNKPVNGYPIAILPCTAHVITGYPQVGTPPSPQPVYLHQLFRHRKRRPEDQAFLFRATAVAMFFFVFLGFLIFTIWLFLRPRLPQVRVASAALTPLLTTDSELTLACNVTLILTNPNHKFTVYYDSFEVLLDYQPEEPPLFQFSVPPFVQPRMNDTVLQAHMEVSNANVGNDVVKALRHDLASGALRFGVKVLASVRVEGKEWKARGRLMKVWCDNVILWFPSENGPGNLLNPYEECNVIM